jgi:hypothetical protein
LKSARELLVSLAAILSKASLQSPQHHCAAVVLVPSHLVARAVRDLRGSRGALGLEVHSISNEASFPTVEAAAGEDGAVNDAQAYLATPTMRAAQSLTHGADSFHFDCRPSAEVAAVQAPNHGHIVG